MATEKASPHRKRTWIARLLSGLPLSLFAFSGLHLAILGLRLPYLSSIPDWFFTFREKPSGPLWLVFTLALIPFAVVYVALRARGWLFVRLLALVVLGGAMQHGFALLEGRGIDGVRDRIVNSGHAQFAVAATVEESIVDVITRYEKKLYDGRLGEYANSKPPGQVVLYMGFERLTRRFASGDGPRARLKTLQDFASYVWPFLSYLVIFPLYSLGRRLTSEHTAIQACVLYLFVPSVALITLHADQVFFPLFAVSCVVLSVLAMSRRSVLLAIASGVAIYLAVFCTFALAFALPIAVAATLALSWNASSEGRDLRSFIRVWSIALAAFLATDITFRMAFDYDIVERYGNAMAYHSQWRGVSVLSPRAYFNRAFVGTLEFIVWLGVPLAWLVIHHFRRSARSAFVSDGVRIGLVSVSLLVIFLVLAFFGGAKIETARLWMFAVPFCCLVASDEISRRTSREIPSILWWVIPLQWMTVYLTKIHQDFY